MLRQIKLLTKLELCNIYNLNTFRYSKDRQNRKKALSVMIIWLFLMAMLIFYAGSLSYGLFTLGLAELIPAYLITLSGLLIFFFGIFRAGDIVFRKGGYDILCSLPVNRTALVTSRFLRLYIENLVPAALILLPGLFVYGWFLTPAMSFYIGGALAFVSLPLLPTVASVLIGTVITGISSRMKHKNLTAAGLSILFVLIIIYGSSRLSSMENNITPEMLKELSSVIMEILGKVYPPAVWFGRWIVTGNPGRCLICTGLFLSVFVLAIILVSLLFHSICRGLFVSSARHNYKLRTLKKNPLLLSLCKREFKRYFSSSVYVTNTIISPIMGCILSGVLLFSGTDSIAKALPLPLDFCSLVPFIIAGIFCIMPTTSSSISMEGKNWWIIKSLPLSPKYVLNAKILMNLILVLPFYLISEVLLILALKPSPADGLFLVLIPAVIILFSCVYGIAVNLHFPVLNWENEISIVKQSTASLLGFAGAFLLAVLCILLLCLIPKEYTALLKLLLCLLIAGAALLLHKRICQPSAWQRYHL